MKISLNSIKGFNKRYKTAGDVTAVGVEALVEKIGAQLSAIEQVERIGDKYDKVVIAKVVSCEDHPNADRLHVCTIDDGGNTPDVKRNADGYVQVVCGAPNVRAGLMVAWLPPGSTVPESAGKDPFVLEARELRGVVSNGMLASPKELALGESHEGILEIIDPYERVKVGQSFGEAFELHDDVVLDMENKMFTHRPDCFGFMGVGRELAGIQGLPYKSPDWYTPNPDIPAPETEELSLEIRNEIPELVPRFTAITMRDVHVGPSPTWLVVELAKVGLRSINNIVDYTNFFMLETGQPLHAYDYDKVAAQDQSDKATIVVRQPREDEQITLLNGKAIQPRPEAIMIATEKKLIGVGGVMGGAETEVDETTKNIIIECANFDMYSVRRTSMTHGLFTDAVTRFNKGQSPLQNRAVLAKIVDEVRSFAGGKVASKVIDVHQLEGREWVHPPVSVTADFINTRLGFSLPPDDIQQLLENVEFSVSVDGADMTVTAPFWRTDIETREDVVEEVGRLYGFDHLPLVLPERSVKPVRKDALLELKTHIRHTLARAGSNEVLTYSFVHGNLLDKAGQDKSTAFSLSNALSPDLQYYRLSLTPSLLATIHANVKAGYDEFALFELGKAHIHGEPDSTEPEVPKEVNALAYVYASSKTRDGGASYYHAKKQLDELLKQYQLDSRIDFVPLDQADLYTNPWLEQMVAPYDAKRSAVLKMSDDTQVWGVVGEFKSSVKRALKLPEFSAGFELDPLLFLAGNQQATYAPLSKYPTVWQDITLKVNAGQAFVTLRNVVSKALHAHAPEDTLVNLEEIGIYKGDDAASHQNVTFRAHITGLNRTLTDKEVSKTIDAIAAETQQQLGAERV